MLASFTSKNLYIILLDYEYILGDSCFCRAYKRGVYPSLQKCSTN